MCCVGIWIDHREAILVELTEHGESIRKIFSNAESNIRVSGGYGCARPYAPQDVARERKFERRRRLHLHRYYQDVIRALRGAEAIVVLGPGEAKLELQKEARKSSDLSDKLVAVEAEERMTDNQLIAKVRKFFAPGWTVAARGGEQVDFAGSAPAA